MIRTVLFVAFLALTQAWSTERITARSGNTMPIVSGYSTNVLGARTGLDAETVGLRHPYYPYGQVDASGVLLGRSGMNVVGTGYNNLVQRGGAHLSAASVVPARSFSTQSFQTSPVQTSSSSFQSSGASTFGASSGLGAGVSVPAVRAISVAPSVGSSFQSTGSSFQSGGSSSFGASSGLGLGGASFQTRQVAVQPAVSVAVQPAVSTVAVQPALSVSSGSAEFTQNVVSPPQVINEPAEVVHEKPTIIQGTVQNLPAENNVQESNMRTEENRQVNRNREINTYTVQKNRVNKVIQNVQRQTHHKYLNTNINTNIKRVHNPHVERELITHVKNQVQPVELIYNKITNTESVSEETRPTQSQSERTVQHPTVTLPLQSSVAANDEETVPGRRSQPVVHPVRTVPSVNQGASVSTVSTQQTFAPSVATVAVQPSVAVVQPAVQNLGFTGSSGLSSGSFQSSGFQSSGSSGFAPATSSSFEQTTVQTGVPTVVSGLSGAGLSGGASFTSGVSGAGAGGFSSGLSGDFARQTTVTTSGAGQNSLGHRSGFSGVVGLGARTPIAHGTHSTKTYKSTSYNSYN